MSFTPTTTQCPHHSNVWSSSRYNANNAWNFNGNNGYLNNNNFNNSNRCVPLSNRPEKVMVKLHDIMIAYERTRKNKKRSGDSIEFELHKERNLVELVKAVNERNVRPTAYTFVKRYPRPREVFACNMGMRVLHHYVDIRLRPLIEQELTSRTFNNRIGMGQNAAVNALITDIYDVSEGYTKDAWIITFDLSGYFPNARQDRVYEQLRSVAERKYAGADIEDVLYMIQASIFSYPTLHCYRKSPPTAWADIPKDKSLFNKPLGTGGAIGHLPWQNAMNYYLNDIDHWAVDECALHYVRFVDDFAFVTDNKEAFLAYMMPELRKRLADAGCTMHPTKFYCQHWSKGVKFIGTPIRIDRVYVNNRTVRRAKMKMWLHNRRICDSRTESFQASINSYLGICKTRNGYKRAMEILGCVDKRWERFLVLDKERMCMVATDGHRHIERLINNYHLKIKKYDKSRNSGCHRSAGVAHTGKETFPQGNGLHSRGDNGGVIHAGGVCGNDSRTPSRP